MQGPESEMTTALRKLAESLRKLAFSLTDLSAALGESLYASHQMPFGPGEKACRIWIQYRQFTTSN